MEMPSTKTMLDLMKAYRDHLLVKTASPKFKDMRIHVLSQTILMTPVSSCLIGSPDPLGGLRCFVMFLFQIGFYKFLMRLMGSVSTFIRDRCPHSISVLKNTNCEVKQNVPFFFLNHRNVCHVFFHDLTNLQHRQYLC